MSAYLIAIDDDKQGVMSPMIIGPFPDEQSAQDFADEMHLGRICEDIGGYSACHVICDATCDYTPDAYRTEYDDDEDD